MTSKTVKLRDGVRIVYAAESSEFPALLVDDLLDQRLKLDATVLAVAEAIADGVTVSDLPERSKVEPELAERALALLDRMHVLDTDKTRQFAADAVAIRAQQSTDPSTLPLLIRETDRFSCTMCGSCCGGHNIGPVTDEVLSGLEPHLDALAQEIQSPKGLFFELPVPRPDGGVDTNVLCHTSDGSCVFLSPERTCRIHAVAGGEKKPGVCQLFPYQFTATPDGIAVSLQMECRGMADARRGTPLTEQVTHIRQLLTLAPPARIRPVIAIDRQQTVGWAEYKSIEEHTHAAIDSATDPASVLLAIRQVLETYRAHSPTEITTTSEDLESYAMQLEQFFEELIRVCQTLDARYSQEDERHVVHTESLDLFAMAAATFHQRLERIVTAPATADQRALFRDHWHHAIHGKVPTKSKRLTLGYARLTLTWLLAHSLAIARARQVKRRHLVTQDVMDGLAVMSFLFRNNDFLRALSPLDDTIETLFYERLPLLLTHAAVLSAPDYRLELTKF